MRKLWCAGAIAGGILLFGSAPAHADTLPNPGVAQDGQSPLRDTLAQTNNWRFSAPLASDPLSGVPLIDLSHHDQQLLQLQPASGMAGPGAAVSSEGANRPVEAATRPRRALPAADVVRGTVTRGTLPDSAAKGSRAAAGAIPFSAWPIDTLVNHAVPALAALGPDGLPVARDNHIAIPARPVAAARTESTAKPAGRPARLPIIGGLAGLAGLGGSLPVESVERRLNDAGLPLGGWPVQVDPERSGSARPGGPSTDPAQPGASTPPADPASPPASPSPDAAQSGVAQSGVAQSGVAQSGVAPTGGAQPGAVVPDAVVPGASQPGAAHPSSSAGFVPPVDPAIGGIPGQLVAPVDPVTPSASVTADKPQAAAKRAKSRAADPRLYEEPTEGLTGAGTE